MPASVAGYPAISVPAAYSREGLPIGPQMVARPWEEKKLLKTAYALERGKKAEKTAGDVRRRLYRSFSRKTIRTLGEGLLRGIRNTRAFL